MSPWERNHASSLPIFFQKYMKWSLDEVRECVVIILSSWRLIFPYNREISGLSLQHVWMPMGLAIDETSPCRDLCSILKCHSHAKKLDCGGNSNPYLSSQRQGISASSSDLIISTRSNLNGTTNLNSEVNSTGTFLFSGGLWFRSTEKSLMAELNKRVATQRLANSMSSSMTQWDALCDSKW